MGFPTWTLVGMGVTAVGALILIGLAYLGQSPALMKQLGLVGARLDLRVRFYTGYAFALLILAFGFFLAGVPLGSQVEGEQAAVAAATGTATTTSVVMGDGEMGGDAMGETAVSPTTTRSSTPTPNSSGSQSGAFGGLPANSDGTLPPTPAIPTATPNGADPTEPDVSAPTATTASAPAATPSATPTTTPSPTPTASPTPTMTPTPTVTPTPIEGETAVIDTGGSTLWVLRTPDGANLVLVSDGDTVILRSGHANRGGILWREVMTVDGTIGWVQEEFLQTSP